MKYTIECDCCGHKETAYFFRLSEGRINGLKALYRHWALNKSAAQMKELGMTPTQYTNFCHLQYWDLARKTSEGWYPTKKGQAFLRGEVKIPNVVATYKKEIIDTDHEAWALRTKLPEMVDIHSVFPGGHDTKDYYQDQKNGGPQTLF